MRFRLLLIFSFNLHSLPSLFSVFNTLRRVHVHGSLTGHAAVYNHSTQFSMQTETDTHTHTHTDSVYPFVVNIDCWSKTRSQFACCQPPSWICHTIFGHPWWTHGSCAPRLHEYLCRCMRQYDTEKTNRAGTNAFEVKCYRHAYVFTYNNDFSDWKSSHSRSDRPVCYLLRVLVGVCFYNRRKGTAFRNFTFIFIQKMNIFLLLPVTLP